MCGITGVVPLRGGTPADAGRLSAMCDTLIHRGPDDAGCDLRAGVALGMRRLAIIDVAGGHQPVYNEDRSVSVVFNGEIYNYRELRAELVAAGHRFTTASDTEVLVHLWEEHGPAFAARLNGIFALALHDSRRRRFVLARDHFGIKPLYYAVTPRHLVFGSEIKAILASGLVAGSLDVDALGQFLAWEYVPTPLTLLLGLLGKCGSWNRPGCSSSIWTRARSSSIGGGGCRPPGRVMPRRFPGTPANGRMRSTPPYGRRCSGSS